LVVWRKWSPARSPRPHRRRCRAVVGFTISQSKSNRCDLSISEIHSIESNRLTHQAARGVVQLGRRWVAEPDVQLLRQYPSDVVHLMRGLYAWMGNGKRKHYSGRMQARARCMHIEKTSAHCPKQQRSNEQTRTETPRPQRDRRSPVSTASLTTACCCSRTSWAARPVRMCMAGTRNENGWMMIDRIIDRPTHACARQPAWRARPCGRIGWLDSRLHAALCLLRTLARTQTANAR